MNTEYEVINPISQTYTKYSVLIINIKDTIVICLVVLGNTTAIGD